MNFEVLRSGIQELCIRHALVFEVFNVLGGVKAEAGISSKTKMASIEILHDGTYDFFTFDIELSDKLMNVHTARGESEVEILKLISHDFLRSDMIKM